MNNFIECKDFAEEIEPLLEKFYREMFDNITRISKGRPDKCQSQANGIDRIIYFEDNKVITIEEKIRAKDYNDILLEYISNDQTNAPGWMEKNLSIDYLVYCILETGRFLIFDWRTLRRAWKRNKEEWKEKYKKVEAENEGYSTHSVCVPTEVLQRAMTKATQYHRQQL